MGLLYLCILWSLLTGYFVANTSHANVFEQTLDVRIVILSQAVIKVNVVCKNPDTDKESTKRIVAKMSARWSQLKNKIR